uniref:Uncharacterized protein n=1 Tax=Meloidogyne hapla TaxID=6305 RepID=A0A1I8BC91_MELHA
MSSIIKNNLSDIDKEKNNEDNYTNSNETIVPDSYNDKDQLVKEIGEYEKEKNDYIQIYNKFWPFLILKFTNLILLLILAVGSILTASYPINWSNYWKTVLFERPYDMQESYAVGQLFLFIFAFCSLIAHRFAKNTFMAAFFSLMDICFYAISIPILIISNIIFSIKSLAEYRWFGPKLANFNYTFEAYVDLTETKSDYKIAYYQDYDWQIYGKDYLLDKIAHRKKQLFINLFFDPASLVLTSFAILLNFLLIFNLYKKMRKSQLWASGLNNYKIQSPNCSLIEEKYSCHYPFGLLKNTQWLLPTILLFSAIYTPFFQSNNVFVGHFILPAIISFIQWLLYYCSVHLYNYEDQNKNAKPIRLSTLFFAALLLFLSIILYGGYSLLLTFIYLQNNGEGNFNFKFPISIKINVEIIQKSNTKEFKNEKEKINEEMEKKEEKNEKEEENIIKN